MTHIDPAGNFKDTKPSENGLLTGDDPQAAPGFNILAAGQAVNLQDTISGNYVNINSSGWAVVESSATTKFVLVQYYDNHYIVVADGDYKNYYLSYNNSSYVGAFYYWNQARYWAVDPVDCSPYPGLYPHTKSSINYLCVDGVRDAIDDLMTVVGF